MESLVRYMLGQFRMDPCAPDEPVPSQVLMSFAEEAPAVKEHRAAAIAYLRKDRPSKYVLDGANVNWQMPTVLRGHQ